MKKYHVYGMGNALVDIEIEVSSEALKTLGVEKGMMTLIDEKRQGELLSQFKGNLHQRSCGGSAANTIMAISQLGGRTFYSCKVANDEMGDFYFKDLIDRGVASNLHGQREDGDTGKCMVFITPDADRTMNTFLGITATFDQNQLEEDDLVDSEYLYIEGYLVTAENAKNAAIHARKLAQDNNVKVALTLSDPGVVEHFRDGFKEIIGDKIDLIFCNHDEALKLAQTNDFEKAVSKLKEVSEAFCITMGKKGAFLWDGNKEVDIVTNQVEAVDTNGAGDLFAGAFLFGLTHGHSFSESGKLACQCSTQLVTQFGARLKDHQPKEIYQRLFN